MEALIETKRLTLRPLTLADANTAYQRWTGDAEVAKYVSWLPHHSIDDTIEWLKEIEWKFDESGSILESDCYIWGFVLKETGALFGSGGLIWQEERHLFQVGYNIMQACWNRGYATEAMRAILSFASLNLGIKRVVASHAKENHASASVLEKLGFAYEGDGMTLHVNGTRHFETRTYCLELA